MNYYLIVIDTKDNIVEKIQADHKTDKQLLQQTKKRYPTNYKFKFGNMVTESQYKEVKTFLEKLHKEVPGLLKEITDKNRPEFRHLGYELEN